MSAISTSSSFVSHCLNQTNEVLDRVASETFQPTLGTIAFHKAGIKIVCANTVDYVAYVLNTALRSIQASSDKYRYYAFYQGTAPNANNVENRTLYFYRHADDHQTQPDPELIKSLKTASEVFINSICKGWKEPSKLESERAHKEVSRPLYKNLMYYTSVMKVYAKKVQDHSATFLECVSRELKLDIRFRSSDNVDYIVGRDEDIQKLFSSITESLKKKSESGNQI